VTPTKNFREICARVEAGLTTAREAKVLVDLVERLVWLKTFRIGESKPVAVGFLCRICEAKRGEEPHKKGCPAEGIE
jgi:hypothetical protein